VPDLNFKVTDLPMWVPDRETEVPRSETKVSSKNRAWSLYWERERERILFATALQFYAGIPEGL